MSESRVRRGPDSWLERELQSRLRPVAAPPDLWRRIQYAHVEANRTAPVSSPWVLIAFLTLLAMGGVAWSLQRIASHTPLDLATLTDSEIDRLMDASGELDFRSADPLAIHDWISRNAHLNLATAPGKRAAGAIRLLGARILRVRGSAVVLLAYLVGARQNTLLISADRRKWNSPSQTSGHAFSRTRRLISWRMHDQIYAIAGARMQDVQGACLLCHQNAVFAN